MRATAGENLDAKPIVSILGVEAGAIFSAILSLVGLFAAVALAGRARVYQGTLVSGPERIGWGRRPWPLLAVMGSGLFVWYWVQAGFIAYVRAKAARAGNPPAQFDLSSLSTGDWAFLAVVPGAVAFIVLLAGGLAAGDGQLRRLGLGVAQIPVGLRKGLIACVIILPPTYLVTWLSENLYQMLHYRHEQEHELLKAMGESSGRGARLMLILGATVVAPLFEELLFRGHVQTLIRRGLIALGVSPPRAIQPVDPGSVTVLSQINGPPEGLPQAQPVIAARSIAWQTWAAILLTSGLFALVHPMWTWPSIFFLALGLGYTYERTGNLWASMTVHCAFNSVSTFLYLFSLRFGGH